MVITTIYKALHKDGYFVIGSTNNLRVRSKNHKQKLFSGNSDFQKYVRQHGGWDKVQMEVLKEWECQEKSEQLIEEGKFIDEVYEDPLCLNMKRAGITPRSKMGTIYKLIINAKLIYYGSTRNQYHRFAAHKTQSKTANTLLYKTIRENGGWDSVKVEIILELECTDDELRKWEDDYIRENWENEYLLNSMPSSTTPERVRELSNARVKKWAEIHPEEAKEQARLRAAKWREVHPEKAREVQQRSNENRKTDPKRIAYNKEYVQKNREELNRKKREKRALQKANIILPPS